MDVMYFNILVINHLWVAI